jgi:signal transduction histidine kinase
MARAVAHSLSGGDVTVDVEVWDENMPLVRGYHDALARALTNIVINAIEASREGAGVVIALRTLSVRDRDMVELSVQDNGVGIPAEQIATIWNPYVTSKPGGTGLGLAIVRQTILAHHGTVEARSGDGEGTLIIITLPTTGSAEPPTVRED